MKRSNKSSKYEFIKTYKDEWFQYIMKIMVFQAYRMLRDYLAMEGINISNPTAWKYANELGLRSVVCRKRYDYLGGKKNHIFPNLVNREFTVSEPNKIWCTDFAYMKDPQTKEKYYNCTIVDLFRREAVATLKWS